VLLHVVKQVADQDHAADAGCGTAQPVDEVAGHGAVSLAGHLVRKVGWRATPRAPRDLALAPAGDRLGEPRLGQIGARQQSSTSVSRPAGIARRRAVSSALEIAVRSSSSCEAAVASTGTR